MASVMRTVLVLGLLAAIVDQPKVASAPAAAMDVKPAPRSTQISFGERCGSSEQLNLHTVREGCCAFPIWPDGQLVDRCRSGGRIITQRSIVDNFSVKRAVVTADSTSEAFTAQAVGYEYLFVCPPGVDLLVSTAKTRTPPVNDVFRMLHPPVGYFGVKRWVSIPHSPSPVSTSTVTLESVGLRPQPTALPQATSPPTFAKFESRERMLPFNVSQSGDFTAKPSAERPSKVTIASPSFNKKLLKSLENEILRSRGKTSTGDVVRNKSGSPKTSGGASGGKKAVRLTLNVSAEARRNPKPAATEEEKSLNELVVDLLQEMARVRLRSPAKTSQRIKEVRDELEANSPGSKEH